MPPSQPAQEPQKHMSWAERGSRVEALVWMHMRSDADSAAPNAQQQPQADWSRMSLMVLAHCGLQTHAESGGAG